MYNKIEKLVMLAYEISNKEDFTYINVFYHGFMKLLNFEYSTNGETWNSVSISLTDDTAEQKIDELIICLESKEKDLDILFKK